MLGHPAVAVSLFLYFASSLGVHVQNDQLLRRRVSLSEIERQSFDGHFHSVQRRDVANSSSTVAPASPTPPPVIGHFAALKSDRHRLAIVHWSGENSAVSSQSATCRMPEELTVVH